MAGNRFKRKKKQVLYNNDKATWENTAKEQPYLMPGTESYEEYQEDLQMRDPFKPDDEWHNKKEKENAERVVKSTKKYETANKQPNKHEGIRNYNRHMAKEAQFQDVKRQAIKNAKKTETEKDDKKVQRAMPKDLDKLVYDNGVTEDEFLPKALKKYQ